MRQLPAPVPDQPRLHSLLCMPGHPGRPSPWLPDNGSATSGSGLRLVSSASNASAASLLRRRMTRQRPSSTPSVLRVRARRRPPPLAAPSGSASRPVRQMRQRRERPALPRTAQVISPRIRSGEPGIEVPDFRTRTFSRRLSWSWWGALSPSPQQRADAARCSERPAACCPCGRDRPTGTPAST